MALDLGELRIALDVDRDPFTRGLMQTRRDLEALPPTVRREMVKVSRVMDEEGRKSGGLLGRGIESGLVRHSPLIVAGIGAALAAGAPLVTAGAGLLFAGVGAVAAAQSLEVREAWTELGRDIRDGAIADSAVLVPVYTQMASEIGAAYQRLRPQIREVFAESAPLIRSFTGGVVDLAENAMPGLLRAVQRGEPVFAGFERFLGATGTGLSEFFDAISAHSPAAGKAFEALGDIVGALLPILGELLGQGAELAAVVLPPLAAALGSVADVLDALGPLLPIVAAGLVGLKVAGGVGSLIGGLADKLGQVAASGGAFAGTAGRMAGGLSAITAAAGPASAGIGFAAASAMAWVDAGKKAADVSKTLGEAMAAGGQQADAAAAYIDRFSFANGLLETGLGKTAGSIEILGYSLSDMIPDVASAREEYDRWRDSQRQLATEATRAEYAINGVTSAMVEQGNQALAAIDSGFAYQHSLNGLEDAQAAYTQAVSDHGTTSEEAERAALALAEQNRNVAASYARQQADLSGLSADSLEYKRILQEEMLVKLYELQSAAGPEMAAAIGQQIAQLQASGVALSTTGASADTVAQKMRDLGLTVTQVPGNKSIFIDAPTADQKRRLEELGLTVRTLPNGRIWVTADTSPAAGTLAAFMNQRRVIQIQAQLNTGGIRYQGAGQQPTRAEGGPVWPGQTFLVGEEGPELVRFGGHGTVIPADETARITAGASQHRQSAGAGAGAALDYERLATAIGSAIPALFHADNVNVVEGKPHDVAEELAYKMRTSGGR